MKRKLTALAAALLLLSACSAEKNMAGQGTTLESDFAVGAEITTLPDDVPVEAATEEETTPEEAAKSEDTSEEVSENFEDAPYEVQQDIEEVVSLSLTLPSFTLESSTAAESINETFKELGENLTDFAATTVYETAQENNTIGFIEGSYDARAEDGLLAVHYVVTERYANIDDEAEFEMTYYFDFTTGARVEK